MKNSVQIVGAGFSSLSAACYLAKAGYAVTVYEKNSQLGGRARQLKKEGFTFDMGPTWYWMPDVFDRFFGDFGKSTADYFELSRLGPAYRVYFGERDSLDVAGELDSIIETFEKIETGAGRKLEKFISKARKNYELAIRDLVYRPGRSPMELVTPDTVLELQQFILTIRDYVNKHFKNERLRKILEFPVLFLGAKPSDTPLFYSFMNYADFGLGTWYPRGGMRSVVDAMIKLAKELGVRFEVDAEIEAINIGSGKSVESIVINGETIPVNILLSGADYKHTEDILPKAFRSYSENFWDRKVMAPSSLLFYVGFNKPLKGVLHHTLFFDSSFDDHAEEIYSRPSWPTDPLFYASFPTKTEPLSAPEGHESAIFLIPLAPGLEDTPEMREKYFRIILSRLELLTNQQVMPHVLFKESYCVDDFVKDYHSYKGNAYGMANTLMQTAFLRPAIKSKKVKNLYFTGQLTVPGPGVPPSLISGKIASDLIIKQQKERNETFV